MITIVRMLDLFHHNHTYGRVQAVPPGVMNIDPETFDTEAAMRKHGYNFSDSTKAPKRRALLVILAFLFC
jgi:hypothetical protein